MELANYDSLKKVIEIISKRISLPVKVETHLLKWASTKHWLKKPEKGEIKRSPFYQTFRKTFSMTDIDFESRKIRTKTGDRNPSKKVKNLIIGWCAEEIASKTLEKNKNIKEINFIGIDAKRILVLSQTPTDPDILIKTTKGKSILIEVVSYSKETADGKVRLKYNKVKQNEKRFFALKEKWLEYFELPTVYLAVDLISENSAPFIFGGANFYGRDIPYPFPGWENQLVLDFDTASQRMDYAKLATVDFDFLHDETKQQILNNNKYMTELINEYGNIQKIYDEEKRKRLSHFAKLIMGLSIKIDEIGKRVQHEKSEFNEIIRHLKTLANTQIKEKNLNTIVSLVEKDIDKMFK